MSHPTRTLIAPSDTDASFELVEVLYERLERASAALELLAAMLRASDTTDDVLTDMLAEHASMRAGELLRGLPELYSDTTG